MSEQSVRSGLAVLATEMPRADAARYGAELYGAPRYSVFKLFGDKETTLSRILADLFDPNGTHGQGPLFLHALMRTLGLPSLKQSERKVTVRTEAGVAVANSTSLRRIDILIETPTHLIGIENKKWSAESRDQLKDYWTFIDKHAKRRGRQPFLLFVSNEKPSIEEARGLPYFSKEGAASIDRVLELASPDIKASRIQDFINDFRHWIGRTFGGQTLMTATNPYREIVQEAHLRLAGFAVAQDDQPRYRHALG